MISTGVPDPLEPKQGPKRPHTQKDPTSHGFWNPACLSALEPGCRILMFLWSLEPPDSMYYIIYHIPHTLYHILYIILRSLCHVAFGAPDARLPEEQLSAERQRQIFTELSLGLSWSSTKISLSPSKFCDPYTVLT